MGRIPARSDSGPDRRVRRLPALLGTPRGTHQIRGRALAVTVRIHQRLEDEWQRQWRPAMTSPEALAVEKFLHRFSRRSLDPIPTDGLLAAKQRIDTVIDERTRQFSLFDAPPALELVPAPSPAPMSQIADVLSPSQVRTFMDCSARWWYKYGLGLPDPKGSSLVRGIVVHRMAEIYLRTKFFGAAPEVDELAEIFEDVWNETSAEGSFQPGEDLEKLKAQTATLARMSLDEVAPEIEPAVIRGEPAIELVNCPKRPGAGGAIPRCKQSSEIPRFGRPKSY